MLNPSSVSRALILIPVLSLVAAGQTPALTWDAVKAIAPGTEVRIAAGNSKPIHGRVDGVTESSLIIVHANGMESFPRAEIHTVSVKKKGHRVRNTFIGLGAGAGAGLALGFAATNNCQELVCGIAVAAATGIGLVSGTVIGVVWPTGGWRQIYAQ